MARSSPKAKDNLVNAEGVLEPNFYTGIALNDACAAVFKRCSAQLDADWDHVVYIQKAFRKLIKEPTLADLNDDDRYQLLSDVGIARLITRDPRTGEYDMTFLPQLMTLLKPLEDKVDPDRKRLVNAQLELINGRYQEGRQQLSTANKHYKQCAALAKAITNQSYNAAAMSAQAWASSGACFGLADQDAVSVKCQLKAIKFYNQSDLSQGLKLAIQTTAQELRIIKRDPFAHNVVINQLDKMKPTCSEAEVLRTVEWLNDFIVVLSLRSQCCFAPAMYRRPCPQHGDKYLMMPLPQRLEKALLVRLNSFGQQQQLARHRLAEAQVWRRNQLPEYEPAQLYMFECERCISLVLAIAQACHTGVGLKRIQQVAGAKSFQNVLQTMCTIAHKYPDSPGYLGLLPEDSQALDEQLAALRLPTMRDIVKRYTRLDKNDIRKLMDEDLAKLLLHECFDRA